VFFTLNPGGADLYYLQRQAASYKRLAIWYNDVEDAGIDAFKTDQVEFLGERFSKHRF